MRVNMFPRHSKEANIISSIHINREHMTDRYQMLSLYLSNHCDTPCIMINMLSKSATETQKTCPPPFRGGRVRGVVGARVGSGECEAGAGLDLAFRLRDWVYVGHSWGQFAAGWHQ